MGVSTMRLQVYLMRAGVGSRRRCESYIDDGRVTVNEATIVRQGMVVQVDDRVQFDGNPIHPVKRKRYIALHKPRHVICTAHDPSGRPTAIGLVAPDFPTRLFTVGRLDAQSTGLLLITNDGRFSYVVQHPSSRIEKEYMVTTRYPIPEDRLQQFRRGVSIGGERYTLKRYRYQGANRVSLELEEGKNREIRIVFGEWRCTITELCRVRIGCLHLGDAPTGCWFELSKREVDWFLRHDRGN